MRRAAAIAIVLGVSACPREAPRTPGRVAPPVDAAPPDAPARRSPEPPGARLPRLVAPTAYRLVLDVDPAQAQFGGEVTIDVAIAEPTEHLWLHARDLEIGAASIEVDGASTPAVVTALPERELIVVDAGRPIRGAARLSFTYRGLVRSDDVNGLFRQRVDGAWYLFSQGEAMHARRMAPSFDEPTWKVPWEVTLVVPPALLAVSNSPEAARTTRDDGKVVVRFAPTPPMPSYLLAIAVGPFDVVEVGPVGRAAVPARILVTAGRAADAAAVAEETPRVVAALEAFFDRPLPLAKLDSVAVPSFPGAMENLGLVTYGSELLLASPARPAIDLRRDYAAIAAHELAHQWFGNLVTMAWWDDLWLNESFATWLADKVVADLDPRRDVMTERRRSRATAMRRDRRIGVTAVRRVIASSAEADAAFDPLAYDKGSAVLAMFEQAVGPERFRDAIRGFIAAHAGGTVTTADFAAALAADGGDVGPALASFLDQPGVPRVELGLDCGGAPAAVASVSRALPIGAAGKPASWRFPLCVRFPDKAIVGERCGWIDGAAGRVELGLSTCPAWIAAGGGGTGYYQAAYQPALAAALREHLRAVPVIDRGTLASGVIAELGGGGLELADAVAWAERLLAMPDRHDAIAAIEILQAIDEQLGPDVRPRWQAWLRSTVGARARLAGLRPARGETAAGSTARRGLVEAAGLLGGDPKLVAQGEAAARAWLDGKGALRGEDLGLALRLAASGRDAALVDRMRERLVSGGDRPTRRLLALGLAAATEPTLVDRAIEVAMTGPLDPFEVIDLIGALLANPAAQDRTWDALVRSPSSVTARVPRAAWPLLAARVDRLCTPARRAEVVALFASAAATDQGTALALADALEAIDDCLARRARHAAGAVAAFTSP